MNNAVPLTSIQKEAILLYNKKQEEYNLALKAGAGHDGHKHNSLTDLIDDYYEKEQGGGIEKLLENEKSGPGINRFKKLTNKVITANKMSFIAKKAKTYEEDKRQEEEALKQAEQKEQDSKRRKISVFEVLQDGLENWEVQKLNLIPEPVMKLINKHGLYQALNKKEKVLLWRHRELLIQDPTKCLSLLGMCCNWKSRLEVLEMYRLLQKCSRLEPFAALFLLDARFPDPKLRAFAVRSLESLSDFTLSELMLQLVQVLKFEPRFVLFFIK